MSIDPRRRPGPQVFVGAQARQFRVEAHQGTHWDFLRRLGLTMRNAAQAGREVLLALAVQLIDWAADSRNIRCAIESLERNGDTAAGLDGVKLRSLTRQERKTFIKAVQRAIRERYCPWPRRLEDIPKEGRSGTRPIEIANGFDRVIERALYQVFGSYLDHRLGPNCLGSRPGISREAALFKAQLIADRENRHVWIFEDLRDAFTKVINPRLRQILLSAGLPERVVDKTFVMLDEHRERGIPQGSPLSGLLLNVYLTSTLERPWRRRHPDVPLIWVVDDLLLLTGPNDDPVALYRELGQLVESAGMQLKGTTGAAICRLDQGERGQWLGYEIARVNRQPRYRISWHSKGNLASASDCQRVAAGVVAIACFSFWRALSIASRSIALAEWCLAFLATRSVKRLDGLLWRKAVRIRGAEQVGPEDTLCLCTNENRASLAVVLGLVRVRDVSPNRGRRIDVAGANNANFAGTAGSQSLETNHVRHH
jgi:hypothetical protein